MFVQSNQIREILPYFRRKLKNNYPLSEIDSIFFLICQEKFGLNRFDIELNSKLLSESELLDFKEIVDRLQQNEPVQYVLGKTTFCNLIFRCDERALIPRPETEELIDLIARDCQGKEDLNLLDVGTGTGCIPLSIKSKFKSWSVSGIDCSKDALDLAKTNAQELGLEVKSWVHQDILNDQTWADKLDLLVSNPPYIPSSERESMHANVLQYEPLIALFVPDHDPTIFYRILLEMGITVLKDGGKIYFEIHPPLAETIASDAVNRHYSQVDIITDLSGHQRFMRITK